MRVIFLGEVEFKFLADVRLLRYFYCSSLAKLKFKVCLWYGGNTSSHYSVTRNRDLSLFAHLWIKDFESIWSVGVLIFPKFGERR